MSNTIKKLKYTGFILSLFIFSSGVLLVNTVSAQKAETQKLPNLNRDKTAEYFPQNGNVDLSDNVFNKSVRNENQLPAQNEIRTGSSDGSKAAKNENGGAVRSKFDFDGDGKTDISIFRPGTGDWWILRSSDGSTSTIRLGDSSVTLAPGAYGGGGVTSPGLAFGIGNITFDCYFVFPPGILICHFGLATSSGGGSFFSVVNDYDGDEKDDFAFFRPSNATWVVRRSSDDGLITTQFGLSTDKPVAADYDGDGKADIAIFRPSNGQWWIKRSVDGVVQVFQFGAGTDIPVQADYTGDGKADVAVFRPSTGEWFVLRSENLTFYSFPFGSNGDVPVTGDYDGDGKSDTAVYRPSTNVWYINRSTGGVNTAQFGASGDIPVASVYTH